MREETRSVQLAPSILASDLSDLRAGLKVCESGGADLVHVDVMDGHFVPNLSFGPPVVDAIAERTRLPLDLHLMVEAPERMLERYLCRATWLSVHWEAVTHVDRVVDTIRRAGVRAGVALNPATPIEVIGEILPQLDFVVLMSVNPGFSGQSFISYVLDKAQRLRDKIDTSQLGVRIEMDGGIDRDNVDDVLASGVDLVVVGSGIFGSDEPLEAMASLRSRMAP